MKLSLILTHYKESEDRCYNSLASIDLQQNIDWNDYEVIIVNDAAGKEYELSEKFLNQWRHIKPKYYVKETNTGPGDTRNYGIEKASGDYVMFMDIEDMLHNHYVLSMFEENVYKTNNDMIFSRWINPMKAPQNPQGIKWIYQTQDIAPAWVFGIFYRRAFLNMHNIRFLPYKIWNEEWTVNGKCMTLTDRIGKIDYPTYVWNHDQDNPESITTSDGQSYSFRILPSWITVFDDLFEWKKKISRLNDKEPLETLYRIYYMIHNFEWDRPESLPYKKRCEEICSYYINKWDYLMTTVSIKDRGEINKMATMSSNKQPSITFDDWYKKIKDMNITEKPDLLL